MGGYETGGEDEGFFRLRTKTGGKVYNDFKMLEMMLYLVSRPIGKDEVPGSNPGNNSKKRLISSEIRRFSRFVKGKPPGWPGGFPFLVGRAAFAARLLRERNERRFIQPGSCLS